MSTDKMTPTPWGAGGSFPYKGNEGYIFATSMRPEILVCKTFGSIDENTPPMSEQMENSKAIVSAINNTYGANINPEAVPELLNALKKLTSFEEDFKADREKALGYRYELSILTLAKAAIEKAKL